MKKITLIMMVGLFLTAVDVMSQDRIFTYVYQSLVLNKGQKEMEVWTPYRTGREDSYRRIP